MILRQGACDACKIRWCWKGKPSLQHANCPACTGPLRRTTGRSEFRTIDAGREEDLDNNRRMILALPDDLERFVREVS